jgi:hypothetical protein
MEIYGEAYIAAAIISYINDELCHAFRMEVINSIDHILLELDRDEVINTRSRHKFRNITPERNLQVRNPRPLTVKTQ